MRTNLSSSKTYPTPRLETLWNNLYISSALSAILPSLERGESCTSIFDALAFWCAGYRNVTCTFDGLTDAHLAAGGFDAAGLLWLANGNRLGVTNFFVS